MNVGRGETVRPALGASRRLRRLARTGLVALVFAAACGPITYVNEVTRTASSEVEAARAARADRYAPYEYTRATAYLRKAREEAAHADFQAANEFGRKATEAARRAIEISLAAVREGDAGNAEGSDAP